MQAFSIGVLVLGLLLICSSTFSPSPVAAAAVGPNGDAWGPPGRLSLLRGSRAAAASELGFIDNVNATSAGPGPIATRAAAPRCGGRGLTQDWAQAAKILSHSFTFPSWLKARGGRMQI